MNVPTLGESAERDGKSTADLSMCAAVYGQTQLSNSKLAAINFIDYVMYESIYTGINHNHIHSTAVIESSGAFTELIKNERSYSFSIRTRFKQYRQN